MIPSTIFLISCYYCTSPVVITLQLLTLLETLIFAAIAVAVASNSTVAVAVDAAVAITDVNTTAVTYAADVTVTAVTVSICAPVADAFFNVTAASVVVLMAYYPVPIGRGLFFYCWQ